jgi:hypothetical protein
MAGVRVNDLNLFIFIVSSAIWLYILFINSSYLSLSENTSLDNNSLPNSPKLLYPVISL